MVDMVGLSMVGKGVIIKFDFLQVGVLGVNKPTTLSSDLQVYLIAWLWRCYVVGIITEMISGFLQVDMIGMKKEER